jgi:hypothetical protein
MNERVVAEKRSRSHETNCRVYPIGGTRTTEAGDVVRAPSDACHPTPPTTPPLEPTQRNTTTQPRAQNGRPARRNPHETRRNPLRPSLSARLRTSSYPPTCLQDPTLYNILTVHPRTPPQPSPSSPRVPIPQPPLLPPALLRPIPPRKPAKRAQKTAIPISSAQRISWSYTMGLRKRIRGESWGGA